ncbi:MAG: hypothetical protein KatS3mg030_581 [Saprospiraceae bacterium]|nr:MAG: hypothetical protein KatS3mg030_581 [Saprospiraceae bacterium]
MNELTGWAQVFFNSFQTFGQKLMGAIPEIIGAILIFLLGWLFSRFISRLVAKTLKFLKFDALAERIGTQKFLAKANIHSEPSRLIGIFVYWILMLLVILSASDALGWVAVSQEVSRLLGLLPNLLVAIVFFIVGTYIATFVRDIIRSASQSLGIAAGRIISSVVFYLLLILVILTSLNQAGVNTDIITNNMMIILAAVLGAAALSYGLASREVMSNILANFFNRRIFTPGLVIEVNGTRGRIVATSSTSVTLETDGKELIVIPASELLTNRVTILKNAKS